MAGKASGLDPVLEEDRFGLAVQTEGPPLRVLCVVCWPHMCLYLSVSLLPVCLTVSLSVCLSACLSARLPVCLTVSLSVCLSVCLPSYSLELIR